MPDPIPDKGASLCTTGAFTFERLEEAGVPTHYRGVVPDDGPVCPLPMAHGPVDEMAVDLAAVPDLPFVGDGVAGTVSAGYDYGAYHDVAGDAFLVPLEIVYRNRVPEGSSLRRRTDPADHGRPEDEWPDGPIALDEPIVEFSTKFEAQDRYLDRETAGRIAGAADLDALADLAREVNAVVTETADAAGLTHADGKIECLYAGGEVRVADVAGTLDENRFTLDGHHVSKEALRQHHRRTQPEWVEAVKRAKGSAGDADDPDWRSRCDRDPEPLDRDVVSAARDLYAAGANAYVGSDLFDAPAIGTAATAFD
jgi:phosphoribosylaminoimidazole-succinocarboxamide synthase